MSDDVFSKYKALMDQQMEGTVKANQDHQSRVRRSQAAIGTVIKPAMSDLAEKLRQSGGQPDINSNHPIMWRNDPVMVEGKPNSLFSVKFRGVYKASRKREDGRIPFGFMPEIGIVQIDVENFALYAPRFPIDEQADDPYIIRERFTLDTLTRENLDAALVAAVASVLP